VCQEIGWEEPLRNDQAILSRVGRKTVTQSINQQVMMTTVSWWRQ